MWKRRHLYQSKHPFNEYPFEALFYGSWQPVDQIRVSRGNMTICSADGQFVIEERGPIPDVRVRSRRATLSDCACFLRVGVDVCVLTTSKDPISPGENSEPVWVDARISSVARKPHEAQCFCQFYVKFYTSHGPLGSEKAELSKETTLVGIHQISILQKLDSKNYDNHLYRWNTSEDCTMIQRTKLFLGKFLSEISWLVVTSALKKAAFAVRSLDKRLVYQILGCTGHGNNLYSDSCIKTVNFKVENEIALPVVIEHGPATANGGNVTFDESHSAIVTYSDFSDLRRSKRRIIQPDRFLGCDVSKLNICTHFNGLIKYDKGKEKEDDYDEEDEMTLPLAVLFGRRGRPPLKDTPGEGTSQSHKKNSCTKLVVRDDHHKLMSTKPRLGRPRKFVSKPVISPQKKDENKLAIVPVASDYVPLAVDQNRPPPVKASRVRPRENEKRYYYPPKIVSRDESRSYQDLDDMDMDINTDTSWVRRPSDRRTQRKRYRSFKIRPDCLTEERIYGQKTLSAGLYKDLINSYMKNINTTVNKEEPPLTDQWKERRPKILTNNRSAEKVSPVEEEEESEIDMLWKEMELCMTSSYLFEDNEGAKDALNDEYMEETVNSCQHEYRLDEEIGILCRICGVVTTEIKDVSPEFVQSTTWVADHKMSRSGFEFGNDQGEDENFELFHNSPSTGPDLSEESENVRILIPDLWKKLHIHQKKAFDFLWRNIAGSLIPADMDAESKKTGGCVVSHTPGAGKTFLIIAFLVSYLKLFPGKRPLVLAPKTTLYTWHKEFVKWQIPIPVYLIHGRRSYRVFKQNTMTLEGLPKPGQDVMHVLDCLEKIQKWHTQPSVLVMGYTSFLTLMREDSKFAHRKYMAKVLRESPGILILDEGHNPRSTKSRLRKVLMKVQTDLRILLSGTLFQNNFCEYFNTLCLARPKFVHEVLMELDPKFKRKKKKKARHLLEARARKFFIDNIGKKIDSSNGEERIQGLNMLRNITNEFIDVYEAGTNENLPGLQIYTLLMNPTDIQLQVLLKLHRIMATYHGYPLELELLITIGSIHPWLVKSACCAGKFFSDEELMQLERHKYDIKKGSKVKFVLSLVYRVFRKEKVLIFCHNIAPIHLFLELFEMVFGWRKGKEVLVITGDLELFERGRVMDQFEEPGGASRVLLASITACAEGVSLTAASRVILLDSEWNPSKTKQAIARAFRPGQQKMVYVYQLLAANTLEEDKYRRTTWKEWVSSMIFSEAFVEDPSCWQAQKMEDEILREMVEEDKSKSIHMIMKNEKASTI